MTFKRAMTSKANKTPKSKISETKKAKVNEASKVTKASDGTAKLALHAEELSVTKQQVETGRVKVGTVTRKHDETVDENLARENVEIKRVAVNRPIDALPAVREDGDTTIVPVVEEVLVVERRLMLKEEIHIRRVHTTERYRERVTLRRQEAVVTRLPVKTAPSEAIAAQGWQSNRTPKE